MKGTYIDKQVKAERRQKRDVAKRLVQEATVA
jgi:hypothetical protein